MRVVTFLKVFQNAVDEVFWFSSSKDIVQPLSHAKSLNVK